ncbi:MAG TPA: MFS transporter [Steroidobacteraceae bacterium]|jgi:PAT family beta-lactamase induction signal transducer AmpG|nr:MFS transporter [Steroidobacteraceae bacterium]
MTAWWRGWGKAILVYRQPRMAASLALGFSCGLPFILVGQTLSAWLRQAGIERATIGMLAWVALLYTIKFLWAPFIDRLQLPVLHRLLGRRRSWMLLAQIGIALAIANLARQDPAMNLTGVALGAMFIAFCSATQDIAVDAWRVESAPPDEQGAMAAGYQLGYRVAVMIGTAGAFWIAADYGWHVSYSAMALLVAVGIAATLLTREPVPAVAQASAMQEQRVIEWLSSRRHWPEWLRTVGGTFVGAVVCPLTDFFSRYGLALGALLFAFIGSYRLTDYTMGPMANPFYIDHGYTLKEVATVVKAFGLVASLSGVVIGGVIVARLGVIRALAVGSVMMMLSNLGFSALASTDTADLVFLGCVNSFDNIAYNIHGTSLLAFLASLTSVRYTATQYAVLSSIYALPGKVLMGTSGMVVDHIDYPAFFVYTASLSIPGLVLLYFVSRRYKPGLGVAQPA